MLRRSDPLYTASLDAARQLGRTLFDKHAGLASRAGTNGRAP